ncbi:MAG: DUF1990 family protein [Actinobacteria bacterium]|nr:DUF1990 family protein [Actinomycetota bacterium]
MRNSDAIGSGRARRELESLQERDINFDPASVGSGWKFDEYCQPLPREPPGDPLEGGSWETARKLMREYEFADPSRVRAVYRTDTPLEGRDMLLEIRFLGLRFDVGVRIGGVYDETRQLDGRHVRVWGWGYRTLEGHLEMGQMDYAVWKWLDSGEVEFRIRRRSRPAPVGNPLVRLGFRIFGRREQVRFAKRACARILRLTQTDLGSRSEGDAGVRVAADVAARTRADGR